MTLSLIHQLVRAHEDGLALSRRLLVAQGIADETEMEADRAFERAAARPWDAELAEYAVAAAVASEHASERELSIAAQWNWHCARARALIEQVRALPPVQDVHGASRRSPQNLGLRRLRTRKVRKNWGTHPRAKGSRTR
jgi:hypothetical protein